MHLRVYRPSKHEQPNRHQEGAANSRRQAVLGLAATDFSSGGFALRDEALVVLVPEGVGACAKDEASEDAQKGHAHLREGEAVDAFEDEGEGAEEKVENA